MKTILIVQILCIAVAYGYLHAQVVEIDDRAVRKSNMVRRDSMLFRMFSSLVSAIVIVIGI